MMEDCSMFTFATVRKLSNRIVLRDKFARLMDCNRNGNDSLSVSSRWFDYSGEFLTCPYLSLDAVVLNVSGVFASYIDEIVTSSWLLMQHGFQLL